MPVNAASNKKGPVSNVKASPVLPVKPTGKTEPPKQTNAEPANKQCEVKTQNDDQIKIQEGLLLKFSKKSATFDAHVVLIQAELYLARVYSRLKDLNTAKSFYEKVIQKEPKVNKCFWN